MIWIWYLDWRAAHHITFDLIHHCSFIWSRPRISRSDHCQQRFRFVYLSCLYYWMLVTLLLNWKMCCMLSLSLTTNYPLTIYKRQWCLYWVSFSLLCRTGTWDVLWGPHKDILYLLDPDRELRTLLVTASVGEQISSGVWHRRMGHPWSKSYDCFSEDCILFF